MMRWISGILMAVLVTALLLLSSQEAVQGVVVLLAMVAFWEFNTMARQKEEPARLWAGVVLSGLTVAAMLFCVESAEHVLGLLTFLLLFSFLSHFRGHPDFALRVPHMMSFFFGLLYVVLLFTYLGCVRALYGWQFWVFLMLASTFLGDTGAYLAGRWFGKHKLAPRLSPKKTIEGFLGGWFAALCGSFIVRFLFAPDYPIGLLLLVVSLIAWIAPLGDLSESMIKRGMNVKDSSHLIPGHGGVLDRVDALLFAGPVVYYFAKYFPV